MLLDAAHTSRTVVSLPDYAGLSEYPRRRLLPRRDSARGVWNKNGKHNYRRDAENDARRYVVVRLPGNEGFMMGYMMGKRGRHYEWILKQTLSNDAIITGSLENL